MNTAWIYLIIAGLLEVCWAIGLKYTNGFSKLWPSVFTIGTLAVSMFLLAKAAQALPIGTAYAIWVYRCIWYSCIRYCVIPRICIRHTFDLPWHANSFNRWPKAHLLTG